MLKPNAGDVPRRANTVATSAAVALALSHLPAACAETPVPQSAAEAAAMPAEVQANPSAPPTEQIPDDAAAAPPGRPPGLATRPFPTSVGGYQFGLTAPQFVQACLDAGGTVLGAVDNIVGCSKTAVPVDLDMGFTVTQVIAIFCGDTACEFQLMGNADPKTAAQVLARFADRYGPAGDPGPITQCDPAWQDSRFRRAWMWMNAQRQPSASVLLVFGCAGTAIPSLSVFYQDPRGLAQRMGAYKDRSGNW